MCSSESSQFSTFSLVSVRIVDRAKWHLRQVLSLGCLCGGPLAGLCLWIMSLSVISVYHFSLNLCVAENVCKYKMKKREINVNKLNHKNAKNNVHLFLMEQMSPETPQTISYRLIQTSILWFSLLWTSQLPSSDS